MKTEGDRRNWLDMTKTDSDVYRVKYKTSTFGVANATVSSRSSLGGVESLLKKALSEINITNLEILAIEKSNYKSEKEGVLGLGIENR